MSVRIEHLTKIYGSQKALDDVSFEAKPGDIVGFLGPNGAGKTTTMKIITGFIPSNEGTANVCGFDMAEKSLEGRKKIGYLPEHNPHYGEMYVAEYLQFIARVHSIKKPAKRIEEMIQRTGLTPERRKKISQLSKGYKQRVGLAQAMIHDPEVLILDEPTSGLDPNQLSEIRSLIKELGKEKTVIFSTHIMQEVQAICNRVIIINKGKIVADDPIAKLAQRVSGSVIVKVEFKEKVDKNQLEEIKGVNIAKQIDGNIWNLSCEAGIDPREEIFRFAKEKNLTLLTIKTEEQNIENIFRQLTSK